MVAILKALKQFEQDATGWYYTGFEVLPHHVIGRSIAIFLATRFTAKGRRILRKQ
jgi:hypothetical protein